MSDTQAQEITVNDPRVQEVAEFLGDSPSEVLDTAREYATEQGLTLDEELDVVAGNVEDVESLEDAMNEALSGDDEDDNDI